ncbi:PCC domain-containing protein [Pendulispora albinea]|uniref:DNA-binding protein n=1 Tax=Pendulispora albinea TaxID=2741071 RepID=A0ABZ2M5W3_9BACT
MKTTLSEKVRYLLLNGTRGEPLPDAVATACRDHGITRVWLRGSGVVSDVVLRTVSEGAGAPDVLRRIAGPVQLLFLEGSLGIAEGAALSLRGVLARETDRGMDTLAGEIVAARIVTFEAIATALDGAGAERTDPLAPPVPAVTAVPSPAATPAPAAEERIQPPTTWSDAIAASTGVREVVGTNAPVPPRPIRRGSDDFDTLFPEAGDLVDHFAFGRCEVLKSDGDRLHLRVGKDSRIREIALEMLRVQPLAPVGDKRLFRLDRKL